MQSLADDIVWMRGLVEREVGKGGYRRVVPYHILCVTIMMIQLVYTACSDRLYFCFFSACCACRALTCANYDCTADNEPFF